MDGKVSLGKVIAFIKASFVSPNLEGTPTAPTAEAGTNTDQIATTAFVNKAIENAVTDVIGEGY